MVTALPLLLQVSAKLVIQNKTVQYSVIKTIRVEKSLHYDMVY